MPTEILMPALSPIMEEGRLVKWLVSEGEGVKEGDLLAEIETEKATLEFEATAEGVVGRLLVGEGSGPVRVGTPIALLLEPGETGSGPGGRATQAPEAGEPADARGEAAPAGSSEARAPTADGSTATQAARTTARGARIFASPLARRLAAERGVDLRQLTGSGPQGRIVRADLDRAGAAQSCEPAPAMAAFRDTSGTEGPARAPAEPGARAHDEVPLDAMRRTIADRVSEANRTVPQVTLRRDIRLDALLACRAEINQRRETVLSITAFVVKACAQALQAVPEANAIWGGDRIMRLRPSDVAVAVAVEGGIYTPVLRDAETRTPSSLSAELTDLVTRARSGRLSPEASRGGTLAISNLGMFGVESFDALVIPPQSAILAVGAATRRPVVGSDGTVTSATVMSVSLTVDHRVIDGAPAAALLAEIAEALEHPVAMLA